VGAEVIVTAVPGSVLLQLLFSFPSISNAHILLLIISTGSISSRSENLDRLLQAKAMGRGVNLLAHSMGGLDCKQTQVTALSEDSCSVSLIGRHLISHVKPTEYTPLSLTTVSTPHRGSPFMDWCAVC
jgi:triacylglycerol lipase